MSSFKPIDIAKEDFRKYLERQGVLDAMTKVLVKCNADRPENAIDFVLENLGDRIHRQNLLTSLKEELSAAQEEIKRLQNEIKTLHTADALTELQIGAIPSNDAESKVEEGIVEQSDPSAPHTDAVVPRRVSSTTTEHDKEEAPTPVAVPPKAAEETKEKEAETVENK